MRARKAVNVSVTPSRGLNAVVFDERHGGLPCRSSTYCSCVFSVPALATVDDLLAVGRTRNAHELAVHGYVHKPLETAYSYQSTVSKNGRSLLGKKH